MSTDKITITDKLRFNIIEQRKSHGISSYDLSKKVGNGHSKFWLQNIESGKTKKISKQDLISIYMILNKTDDPNDVIDTIEQVLNRTITDKSREWYELIDISDEYAEIYNEDDLMKCLNKLLNKMIIPEIKSQISEMSIDQMQAALTAFQQFYYSLYMKPDLVFALIGIPVYGIPEDNDSENMEALNTFLSLYAKYNNLAIKNNSLDEVKEMQDFSSELNQTFQIYIHEAFDNFISFMPKLYNNILKSNPDLFTLKNDFINTVTFQIELGHPNVLKNYLKSFRIRSGKDFATHIKDCIKWFCDFQNDYDLPYVYDKLNLKQLPDIYTFLENYGLINNYSPPAQ